MPSYKDPMKINEYLKKKKTFIVVEKQMSMQFSTSFMRTV